jgi:hypothetical protein
MSQVSILRVVNPKSVGARAELVKRILDSCFVVAEVIEELTEMGFSYRITVDERVVEHERKKVAIVARKFGEVELYPDAFSDDLSILDIGPGVGASCAVTQDEFRRAIPSEIEPENSGGDVNYYLADIHHPKRLEPYKAECEDIIAHLEMDFFEGEAFKAIWRKAAARMGKRKAGNSGQRDADKVKHYGTRMSEIEAWRSK